MKDTAFGRLLAANGYNESRILHGGRDDRSPRRDAPAGGQIQLLPGRRSVAPPARRRTRRPPSGVRRTGGRILRPDRGAQILARGPARGHRLPAVAVGLDARRRAGLRGGGQQHRPRQVPADCALIPLAYPSVAVRGQPRPHGTGGARQGGTTAEPGPPLPGGLPLREDRGLVPTAVGATAGDDEPALRHRSQVPRRAKQHHLLIRNRRPGARCRFRRLQHRRVP